MLSWLFRVLPLLGALLLTACAGTRIPHAAAPHARAIRERSLDETRALALIDELLLEARLEPTRGWQVRLPAEHSPLPVDLRVGDSEVGVEWISERDRARYGDLLPRPDPGGQLRVLAAADPHAGHPRALVLVLDHESYRYSANARAALDGAPDENDVEQRLRRDLKDFIDYAKTQLPL